MHSKSLPQLRGLSTTTYLPFVSLNVRLWVCTAKFGPFFASGPPQQAQKRKGDWTLTERTVLKNWKYSAMNMCLCGMITSMAKTQRFLKFLIGATGPLHSIFFQKHLFLNLWNKKRGIYFGLWITVQVAVLLTTYRKWLQIFCQFIVVVIIIMRVEK